MLAAAGHLQAAPAAQAGQLRHARFTLGQDTTRQITRTLARRLALPPTQVLTGVFALALARWQNTDEVSFDIRSDPRTHRPHLRRQVGRLADRYPVHLAVPPAPTALAQLSALAAALAASAGRADGQGFGACREFSPDPGLRRTLRALPPARACLTLHPPGQSPSVPARPLTGNPPRSTAHPLQVHAALTGGRLHLGLDWTSGHDGALTDAEAAALTQHLRGLLEELAAAPAPLTPVREATPQQAALYRSSQAHPGTGRHIEQLVWDWHGPLDLPRFTAAWQCVCDRETILRTAFTPTTGEVRLTVHPHAAPEITRRTRTDGDWDTLLEHDRLRGFDLHRPAPLRLTLLPPPPTP
ncbi:hypothetical protein KBY47_35915, partial [Streptomyces sp. B93]|nr:hypothetical protein [Streptomyces sp. B93]